MSVNMSGISLPELPSLTEVSLGKLVIIGGIAIVAGGVLAAFFNLTWGIVLGASGALVVFLSVMMQESLWMMPYLFAGAAIGLSIYGWVVYKNWKTDKKSLVQTTVALSKVKKEKPSAWSEISPKLKELQDSDVKANIDKIMSKVEKV